MNKRKVQLQQGAQEGLVVRYSELPAQLGPFGVSTRTESLDQTIRNGVTKVF